MANYRRRQRAYEGEANRAAAIQRMRTSSSVAQRMESLRKAADTGPRSRGGSVGPPGPKTPIPKSQQPVQKGPPQEQRNAALRAYRRAGHERQVPGRRPHDVNVRRGQTLWGIAERRLGSGKRWREIARANNIRDPRKLQIGTRLRIPGDRPKPMAYASPPRPKGPSDGTHGAALNRVAQMRASRRHNMDYLPRRRRGRYRRPPVMRPGGRPKPRTVNV